MTPKLALVALGNFCWVYALILTVAWFRAVAQRDLREHIGWFVDLLGTFIPGFAIVFAAMLVGGLLELTWLVAMIIVAFPAALAAGLHVEVARLTEPDPSTDRRRMIATTVLALGLTVWMLQKDGMIQA